MDIKQALKKKKEEVDRILEHFLLEEKGQDRIGRAAMNYSFTAPGKRIRPILLESAFYLFAKEEEERVVLPILHAFMASIEMMHSFSLCHDDLPAMDNDRLRRGQDSTWAHFDEAQGILAGDALSLYAFQSALEAYRTVKCSGALEQNARLEKKIEERVLSALFLLSKEAGIDGMVGGQVVDILKEGQALSEEELFFIMEKKTAALLKASLLMGAVLAGAGEKEQEALSAYGEALGLAFQIQDDILDEISTTEELGKPVHSDKEEGKTTAYTLYGREGAEKKVREYTEKAVQALDGLHDGGVQSRAGSSLNVPTEKAGGTESLEHPESLEYSESLEHPERTEREYLFLRELTAYLAGRRK